MKALGVLESKWDLIRQKLVRRLLEEQDKVLRSYFAQKGGARGQKGKGIHGKGREPQTLCASGEQQAQSLVFPPWSGGGKGVGKGFYRLSVTFLVWLHSGVVGAQRSNSLEVVP